MSIALPAHAALRSPQVPVSGTALQTWFTVANGQTLNVNTDQLDLQTLSLPSDVILRIDGPTVNGPSDVFGLYNASLAAPPLYQVFPGGAAGGWYAFCAFHTAPPRVVVNLFNPGGAPQGVTTYLGADPANVGFFLQTPAGILYSQDERNADGARMLAFDTTPPGATWWLAWETSPGPGGDFFDSLWLIGYLAAPVPVNHTNWGTLKQRFR
jgi:hypothetical protein